MTFVVVAGDTRVALDKPTLIRVEFRGDPGLYAEIDREVRRHVDTPWGASQPTLQRARDSGRIVQYEVRGVPVRAWRVREIAGQISYLAAGAWSRALTTSGAALDGVYVLQDSAASVLARSYRAVTETGDAVERGARDLGILPDPASDARDSRRRMWVGLVVVLAAVAALWWALR